MKPYLMVTSAVFGLITVAHIWRIIAENPHLAVEPWYVVLTLAAVISHFPKSPFCVRLTAAARFGPFPKPLESVLYSRIGAPTGMRVFRRRYLLGWPADWKGWFLKRGELPKGQSIPSLFRMSAISDRRRSGTSIVLASPSPI